MIVVVILVHISLSIRSLVLAADREKAPFKLSVMHLVDLSSSMDKIGETQFKILKLEFFIHQNNIRYLNLYTEIILVQQLFKISKPNKH